MVRLQMIIVMAAGFCALAGNCASAEEAPTPDAWPAGVAPELQRIQRELGGSAVDRFEALKETAGPAWATDHARSSDERRPSDAASERKAPWVGRPQIETLRDAAGQIDILANRLERLELYAQADSLRDEAQKFRLEARRMAGGQPSSPITPMPEATAPTPALYDAPSSAYRPETPRNGSEDASTYQQPPMLQPSLPMPSITISPSTGVAPSTSTLEPPRTTAPAVSQPTPTITPTPSSQLEPTPLPENEPQPPSVGPTPLQE